MLGYFDLAHNPRVVMTIKPAEANRQTAHAPVIPQYVALLLGIAVQPIFDSYRHTGEFNLTGLTSWAIISMIIALMIFPSVYKAAFDPTRPLFVQLCTIFTAGIGWQSLLQTAQAASSPPVAKGVSSVLPLVFHLYA